MLSVRMWLSPLRRASASTQPNHFISPSVKPFSMPIALDSMQNMWRNFVWARVGPNKKSNLQLTQRNKTMSDLIILRCGKGTSRSLRSTAISGGSKGFSLWSIRYCSTHFVWRARRSLKISMALIMAGDQLYWSGLIVLFMACSWLFSFRCDYTILCKGAHRQACACLGKLCQKALRITKSPSQCIHNVKETGWKINCNMQHSCPVLCVSTAMIEQMRVSTAMCCP